MQRSHCQHQYHRECLTQWYSANPVCPTCRRPKGSDDERPLQAVINSSKKSLNKTGLFDSSDAFISNWADQAPAFVGVRAGYDVWLGNTRGNKYSRKHVKLNPDINRQQFWDFDLEQMGQYDLPAELDFVASYTSIEKIAYIGHS